MNPLRRIGMYLSLSLISIVGFVRYWIAILKGKRGSVGVRVIVVDDRKVLLVSHWFAPWAWTLPGGGVDPGEDPEKAAMREVKEETGIDVQSLAGEIGRYTGAMGKNEIVLVYYTGDFTGSLLIMPTLEIMARSWFDIDNLPREISPANRRRIDAYRAGVRGERKRW